MEISEIYYHCRLPKNPEDFWKLNVELSYYSPFAEFSKKKNSAKIMYAIYLIYDPKSQLVNSGEEATKIKKEVSKNFLGDEKFDWSEYSNIVKAYNSYSKTKIEKELDDWYLELKERKQFIKDTDWEVNAQLKDTMIGNTPKYFDTYHDMTRKLKQERVEKKMFGGYTPSLLEAYTIDEG